MSGGGSTVTSMEKLRETIESDLFEALELGRDTEAALVEAAGLIAEAEESFLRLSRPQSRPPPPV